MSYEEIRELLESIEDLANLITWTARARAYLDPHPSPGISRVAHAGVLKRLDNRPRTTGFSSSHDPRA